jgi:hypothetical protein
MKLLSVPNSPNSPDIFGAVAPLPLYPPPGPNYAQRSISTITDFIIHHSAGSPDQTPLQIDAEHRARGMAFIAYNWIITKDGTIYQGRPIGWVSSANYGRNSQGVAVCLTGNFDSSDPGFTGDPDPEQIKSLYHLAFSVHIHLTSIERTYGHGDIAPLFYPSDPDPYSTACPGDRLQSQIPSVRNYVTVNLHAGL